MHIGFRTSGGRGEYEVVGSQSGFTAAMLEGWSFYMHWPDGVVRDTGLWLDPGESGKPRLRSLLTPAVQIGRIVSSMLLLPAPRRDVKTTPSGWPVLVENKYSVTQVGFGLDSEFTGVTDRVTFVPSWVQLANQSETEAIGVAARWERIQAVYDRMSELPPTVGLGVAKHRDYLAASQIVDGSLSKIVAVICTGLLGNTDSIYLSGHDPLPALEVLVDIEPPDEVEPALPPPNELSEDEPEINVRSAHQYRIAKMRGSAGRTFSEAVRAAYNNACAICGAEFGGIEGVRSGIDAAHILAWSKHDLDVVSNGIALCKLHHWAFDAGVMFICEEKGTYRIRFTTLADRFKSESLTRIGAEGDDIPDAWLPSDPAQRPSKRYLELLQADLGVTLKDSL
ncbi:MAG: HNH endonuclease [Nostocoides sp.]|jgi:hypothetical protein|uniref:HNH endonuclease n=1 Tax=Nostocoides sp. TaxID=1917966 RepID=UPI003C72E3CF